MPTDSWDEKHHAYNRPTLTCPFFCLQNSLFKASSDWPALPLLVKFLVQEDSRAFSFTKRLFNWESSLYFLTQFGSKDCNMPSPADGLSKKKLAN
mmetsp:Transcript_40881/g.104599  ORF Transcript_40881/g.104599 Transcript_40881/m.104599 type:complete len:95 (+) Transcript_40881:108-392(+)